MAKEKSEAEELEMQEPVVGETEITVEATPNYRQMMSARFRDEYPEDEADYETDDEAYGRGLERYTGDRDKLIEQYRENSGKLTKLFNETPEAGGFIASLMDGSDVLSAIAENFGDAMRDALEDDGMRQKYQEGVEKWRKKRAESEALLNEQQENVQKYAEGVERWMSDKGLTPEEREAFAAYAGSLLDALVKYEMTEDVLNRLWKAYKYEDDVASAAEKGEIRGRNENIMLERGLEEEGDNLPMTGGGGRDTPSGGLEEAARRRSIWDRG